MFFSCVPVNMEVCNTRVRRPPFQPAYIIEHQARPNEKPFITPQPEPKSGFVSSAFKVSLKRKFLATYWLNRRDSFLRTHNVT